MSSLSFLLSSDGCPHYLPISLPFPYFSSRFDGCPNFSSISPLLIFFLIFSLTSSCAENPFDAASHCKRCLDRTQAGRCLSRNLSVLTTRGADQASWLERKPQTSHVGEREHDNSLTPCPCGRGESGCQRRSYTRASRSFQPMLANALSHRPQSLGGAKCAPIGLSVLAHVR